MQALSKGGKQQQRHVVSNVNTAGCGCTSPVARCALLVVVLAFYKRSRNRRKLHAPKIAKQKSRSLLLPAVHSKKRQRALPASFKRFTSLSRSVTFDCVGVSGHVNQLELLTELLLGRHRLRASSGTIVERKCADAEAGHSLRSI